MRTVKGVLSDKRPGRAAARIIQGSVALLLVGIAASSASSCADPEATFYVVEPVRQTITYTQKDGKFEAICGDITTNGAESYLPLDCAGNPITTELDLQSCFRVRSELGPSASDENNRNERRIIVFNEATVTLEGTSGGTFALAGHLDPGEGGAFSENVFAVSLTKSSDSGAFIQSGTGQGSVILRGRTTGGLDVETPEYFFQEVVVGVLPSDCDD